MKLPEGWLEEHHLFRQRASYFFQPQMIGRMDRIVFPTYPLYLRDIVENGRISSTIHGPVTFFSRPVAHYLFQEYPLHLVFRTDSVFSRNEQPFNAGAACIFDKSIDIDPSDIVGFRTYGIANKMRMASILRELLDRPLAKVAVSKTDSPGVFGLDRGIDRDIRPGQKVMDKRSGMAGSVQVVEPGDTGLVTVALENGATNSLLKHEFDMAMVVLDA